MPKQGDREPWINTQDYKRELRMIRRGDLQDGSLIFDNPAYERGRSATFVENV